MAVLAKLSMHRYFQKNKNPQKKHQKAQNAPYIPSTPTKNADFSTVTMQIGSQRVDF
jgi:hypothetical protein